MHRLRQHAVALASRPQLLAVTATIKQSSCFATTLRHASSRTIFKGVFGSAEPIDQFVTAIRDNQLEQALSVVEEHADAAEFRRIKAVVDASSLASRATSGPARLTDLEQAVHQPKLEEFIDRVEALFLAQQHRTRTVSKASGLPFYNMVVVGNQGVGKHLAAHRLAATLHKHNILPSDNVVTVRAEFLYHLYRRQSMVPFINAARGGVLFIVDVNVMRETDLPAFHALLEAMRSPSGTPLVTVMSCFKAELSGLRKAVPEFQIQFPFKLELPDLELKSMGDLIAKTAEKRGFQLEEGVQAQLPALLRDHVTASDARSMNSMLAGKVLADAVQRHSQRIVEQFAAEIKAGRDHPALVTLRREDFGIVPPGAEGAGGRDNDMPHTVLKDLDLVIGLRKVKQHIRALHATTLVNSARRAVGLGLGSKQASKSLHMVFKGNPGTGKSTMAKIIARLLKGMGLLKHGQLVSARRSDLVAQYVGQTAHRTMEVVQSAMGGVLLIDEAYSLVQQGSAGHTDQYGMEALNTLLDVLETNRDDFVVILAGYPVEMEELLSTNPGLRSRFPTVLDFEDFDEDELFEIAQLMLEKEQYSIHEDAEEALKVLCDELAMHATGNARSVRNVLERAQMNHARRIADTPWSSWARDRDALSVLQPEDFHGVRVTANT